MITLENVRRAQEKTYFFLSRYRKQALLVGLEAAGATDFEILGKSDALARLPAGFQVPRVGISPGATRPERHVVVLVSNYDPGDLEAWLDDVEASDEYRAYLRGQSARALASRREDGHEA